MGMSCSSKFLPRTKLGFNSRKFMQLYWISTCNRVSQNSQKEVMRTQDGCLGGNQGTYESIVH